MEPKLNQCLCWASIGDSSFHSILWFNSPYWWPPPPLERSTWLLTWQTSQTTTSQTTIYFLWHSLLHFQPHPDTPTTSKGTPQTVSQAPVDYEWNWPSFFLFLCSFFVSKAYLFGIQACCSVCNSSVIRRDQSGESDKYNSREKFITDRSPRPLAKPKLRWSKC